METSECFKYSISFLNFLLYIYIKHKFFIYVYKYTYIYSHPYKHTQKYFRNLFCVIFLIKFTFKIISNNALYANNESKIK